MQVSVATVQVQPVPDSAVIVRPAGGVSVTVTVPLDGVVPDVCDRHGVRDGLPGDGLLGLASSQSRGRFQMLGDDDFDRICRRAVAGVCIPAA